MNSRKINEYKKSLKLSKNQREVLVGILLGDACLESQNSHRTYRLKVEQSEGHLDYLNHLYEIFREWILSKPHKREVESGNSKSINYTFSTVSHPAFRFYAQQFYKGGKKVVPKLIKKLVTEKALAYWFMDDGSIKSAQSRGIILNTQAFTKWEVLKLVEVLKEKFSLECSLRKQKSGYQIYISGRSFEKFYSLVSPYVVESMKYKFPISGLNRIA